MANSNKSKNYRSSHNWGRKTIKENYYLFGEEAIYKCDKATETCKKYATDKRLTKTKNGKKLTSSLREYYSGIADGMQQGYNDLIEEHKKKSK